MNKDQFPQGPLYILSWSIPKDIANSWTNPVPRAALAVPEVVEDLGDMSEARVVIDYIRSL